MLLPTLVLARDGLRRFRSLSLGLALSPGLIGAFGTYLNWHTVERALPRFKETERFEVFNQGSYEAGTVRFIGFGLAVGLMLSLAALAGLRKPEPEAKAEPANRFILLSTLALLASAGAAALLGAASAVLVALPAALLLWISAALPIARRNAPAQVERTVHGGFALFFASAMALERCAAEQAVLWPEKLGRAARIDEILAADAARQGTLMVLLFVWVVFLGVQAYRLRDAGDVPKLLRGHLLPLTALLVVTGVDVLLAGNFRALGRSTREALSSQLALFSELDPPSTRALPPEQFAPAEGPALQVSHSAVGINGHEIVRLNVAGTPLARQHLQDALMEALARASDAPLSCLIDHRVTWGQARELLSLARSAGATEAELLFTRGPSPKIPTRGPPEVSWVTPADFVAVRVLLASEGSEIDGQKTFGELAPDWVAAALAGKQISLTVPLPGAVRSSGH